MNIHPILVHFPIAFLTLYSFFEFLRFKKITKYPYWFYLKAVLLFFGVLGAFLAGASGKLVENQFLDRKALVQLHSTVNELATLFFAFIALAYFIGWIKRSSKVGIFSLKLGKLWKICLKLEHFVLETPLIYLLVILGFILITIGGALGAIIVYGPDLDPFTKLVNSIFFH